MDDIYKNIDDYNPTRKWKIILIAFVDIIADIMTNKNSAVTKELFIRCRKCTSEPYSDCMFLSCHARVSEWIHTL